MPPAPPDITVNALLEAKTETLKWWIAQANEAAKSSGLKPPLTKVGKKPELQRKVADYYGLDLSVNTVSSPPRKGPPSLNRAIQRKQWAHLRELGAEWKRSLDCDEPFLLCAGQEGMCASTFQSTLERGSIGLGAGSLHPHLQEGIRAFLNMQQVPRGAVESSRKRTLIPAPPTDRSMETIYAWLGAAQNGDVNALAQLFQLQSSLSGSTLPGSELSPNQVCSWPSASSILSNSSFWQSAPCTASRATSGLAEVPLARPQLVLPSVSQPPLPSPSWALAGHIASLPFQSSGPSEAAASSQSQAKVLDACSLDLKALNMAKNLREVIAQVDSGQVKDIRDRYGPTRGSAGSSAQWKMVKTVVNKRERIYTQLASEFNGDKDRFFAFFTIPARKRKSLPGKSTVDGVQLRPSNKVAAAIYVRDKDLKEEMKSSDYHDGNGHFQGDLWETRWQGRNQWEIWRELGKERY
jgi:hypothetical protein